MSDGSLPDLHSAAYFGDQRDFWWNSDFLALIGHRLGLASVSTVLDAGCGIGHWSRALLPHLPRASLIGIDREPAWVSEAAARAEAAGLGKRTTYRVADVGALPFADAAFDFVTCQTVLIHVADVLATLRELVRVLRPGGWLLAAEPNNLANAMVVGSVRHADPIDARLELVRLHMLVERGKIALGEGDNSVGDLLPGLFAEVSLGEVSVWVSDRASMLLPPYASRDQQAVRNDMIDLYERGFWGWSRSDTERFYRAGGGDPGDFERIWERARAALARDVAALRAGTFHCAGGGVQYVIAGRRA